MAADHRAKRDDGKLLKRIEQLESENASLAAQKVTLDAEAIQLRAQTKALTTEVEDLRRQVDEKGAARPAVTFNQLGAQLKQALASIEDAGTGATRYVARRAEFELKGAFDSENDELVLRLPALTQAVDPGLLGTLRLELAGAVPGDVDLSDLALVPTVLGMTEQGASNRLAAADLTVGQTTERESVEPVGTVIDQDPDGGTYVEPGTAIDLVLASDRVTVPDLAGQAFERAGIELERRGLAVGTVKSRTSEAPEGTVVAQQPKAGTSVDRGTAVDLTLAEPPRVSVPGLLGLTVDEAASVLADADLQVGPVVQRPSAERRGTVIEQTPEAGTDVKPGTRVALVTAGLLIRRARRAPDVVGMTREAAVEVLDGAGFDAVVEASRAKITAESFDTVVSQVPPAGTMTADPTVTIRIVASVDPASAVDGIGPKTAQLLRKAKINTIGTLAFTDAESVVDAIGGSPERAAEFIAEARDRNDAASLAVIEGIDREEAYALVTGAGIRRPALLAQQEPALLARTLQAARRRGEVDDGFSLARKVVARWVEAAQGFVAG